MQIKIQTRRKDEIIDITDKIQQFLERINFNNGICLIFVQHTTCCLTTADLDPGTDQDLLNALRTLVPHLPYRHPHDPSHAPDHLLSSIIGTSLVIPFKEKKFVLGIWQRIILIELDGPRERNLFISFINSENDNL